MQAALYAAILASAAAASAWWSSRSTAARRPIRLAPSFVVAAALALPPPCALIVAAAALLTSFGAGLSGASGPGVRAWIVGACGAIAAQGAGIALSGSHPLVAGALVYLAIVGSALTFTLYYWLLRRVRASRVALIAYATPVIAVATGVIFLHEPLTSRFVMGGGLVIAGVAFTAKSRY